MDELHLSSAIVDFIIVLSPIILITLTWLSVEIAKLINAKVKNEKARAVLIRLDDAVFMVVRELEQSTVANLKAANADRKLTDQEIVDIKKTAIDNLFKYMGAEIFNLSEILGFKADVALRDFIKGRIEAALHTIRNRKQ